MTNSEKAVFGYTKLHSLPVQYTVEHAGTEDERSYWQDVYGNMYDANEVIPVRTLAADEVAVGRASVRYAIAHLEGEGFYQTAGELRAALDAAPAEPTAEDEVPCPWANVPHSDCPYCADPSPREASTPEPPCGFVGNSGRICTLPDGHDGLHEGGAVTEPARPSLPDEDGMVTVAQFNDPEDGSSHEVRVDVSQVEQGDTGSDSWVSPDTEVPAVIADVKAAEDRAVQRGQERLDIVQRKVMRHTSGALQEATDYTDRRVAEAAAQIVAAIESQTTKAAEDRAVKMARRMDNEVEAVLEDHVNAKVAELREELTTDKQDDPPEVVDKVKEVLSNNPELLTAFNKIARFVDKHAK